jgi:F-type H+-transporting ATPase subunit gamma
LGYNIISEFIKNDVKPSVAEVAPIAKTIIDQFLAKKYDKVLLAYTDFVSPTKQVPRMRQLLPIELDAEDQYLGATAKSEKLKTDYDFIMKN